MSQAYNIDTWIKVLETLKYRIDDELSRMGSDVNILPANKDVGSYRQKIDIHFNYKNGEVKNVFIREHSSFPNLNPDRRARSGDRLIRSEDFIKENLQLFRNEIIRQILE